METVLVSEGGASCGYVNYINEKFWCGCHCYKLTECKTLPRYLYEKAVSEGFLVDYANFDSTPRLLKFGLKYDDLSENEKESYEEAFADEEGNFPKQIDKKMFYKRIMNTGTIDTILQTLMGEGLKIDCGEKLGKSIIFAYNHDHAKAIVERFNALYPEKGSEYCKLVDYSVNYVSTIVNDFKNPAKNPVIAVSVDMLDTGVDVPEVLNLVFFKKVFSLIKFWQMIGRGTRICKELYPFSPSREFFENPEYTDDTKRTYADKQGFYIFDCCENFVLPKDNNEALDFFIAAKKIEGCSIKSLNYYYTNVIYNELRLRGFSVDVGVINTRENGVRKQLEVDFVCNLGLKR